MSFLRTFKVRKKLLLRQFRFWLKEFFGLLSTNKKNLSLSNDDITRPDPSKRSQSLTRDAIYEHGRRIAEEHVARVVGKRSRTLYARFTNHCLQLETAHASLEEAAKSKEILTPGAEWLLDNYHLVLQQITDIKRHFPRGYDRTLPKLLIGKFQNYPRVYHLALELLGKSDAVVNVDLLTSFIRGYQSQNNLTMGEIWAVPIMLRFALIENLSAIVSRMALAKEERKAARQLIDELVGDDSRTGTQILLALSKSIDSRPELLKRASSHIIARLREIGRKAYLALQWVEEKIREEGLDPEAVHRNEQYILAADQVSIGNTVNSLRAVNLIDWKEWFESVSVVEKILKQDPIKCYQMCDFKTRDRYRHTIELLAKLGGKAEADVARLVVQFAEKRKEELEKNPALGENYITRRAHVGYYLIGAGLSEFENYISFKPAWSIRIKRTLMSKALPCYLLSILALTSLFTLQLLQYLLKYNITTLETTLVLLFFIVPASDLSTSLVQWLVTRIVKPVPLPKLDLSKGIPESTKTAVVVQAIFSEKDSVLRSIEGLEIRYLANKDPNLIFGILADFPDSNEENTPNDQQMYLLAQSTINDLNKRHNTKCFFVLFRKRSWNESQSKFMGWERKRGKIEEFNHLILGKTDSSFITEGIDLKLFSEVRYIITLDNDSQLPRGSAEKLVATISHPLNVARLATNSSTTGTTGAKVLEGYGIIQPRVGVTLVSANSTLFSRIFSGHSGLDPYTQTVSEVYQDLFQEGSYVGKGIYDVNVFANALEGYVPDNSILSHDLFEGIFSRVALASDIEIFEDFSTKYHVHTRRQHRWVRGDWQLLPWIFSRVPNKSGTRIPTPLNPLGRWKLVDNLRRSVLAPSLLLFCLSIWLFLPPSASILTLLVLLTVAFPVYANLAQAFLIPPRGLSLEGHVKGVGRDIFQASKQAILTICFIPHQAALMLHAISITLYRLFISKKNLLEWETAYSAEKRLHYGYKSILREMRGGIFLTFIAILLVLLNTNIALNVAAPFLLLWISSPVIAKRLSDPLSLVGFEVNKKDKSYLEKVAWDSWRFFRDLMVGSNNYLIPDNIQLVPKRIVVDRTSITNISLSLLSTVSAYDLGFLSLPKTIELLNNTYQSLNRLERFHGHFLNWYNVQTLASLSPRYISMVDSGNMLGYLITMRVISQELYDRDFVTEDHLLFAKDLLTKIESTNSALSDDINRALNYLSNVESEGISLVKLVDFSLEISAITSKLSEEKALPFIDLFDFSAFFSFVPILSELERILKSHAPQLSATKTNIFELFQSVQNAEPSLNGLRKIISATESILHEISSISLTDSLKTLIDSKITDLKSKSALAEGLLEEFANKLSNISNLTHKFINEMDFGFLYDSDRDLFPIGYDVDNARRDQSYYDLLASEARLGSLSAIAVNQVPQQHWFSLGRPLTDSLGGKVLMSWSGTMFEYLMPMLVTKDYPGTILSESYKSAVRSQIIYGKKRGVPWGISESGYSGVDFEKTYQYHAFGVPSLGLKRGLEDDLVISPYSTFLALPFAFREGMSNLKLLEQEGGRGEYGFYEAIDYTPNRLSGNEKSHIVKSYLAHHQGMILVAINNILQNNIMQERFHADREVKATELLLHEKFPDRLPIIVPHSEHLLGAGRTESEETAVSTSQTISTPHTSIPVTHLLSNSRYSIMLDNGGGGYSAIDRDVMLTRWREDPLLNNHGTFFYIRDLESRDVWSNTYQPTTIEPESYEVIFGPDKAEYKRKDFGIFVHSEITISPEENVEIRKITLTNVSSKRRILDVTSYGEVVLTSARADNSHPAFSKMFIESEYLSDLDCLLFSRRPRSKHEQRMYFFHMLTMRIVWDKVHFESSRSNFIGRGRTVKNPSAINFEQNLSGTSGLVLDPIFSLRTRLELEPGQAENITFISAASKDKEKLNDINKCMKYLVLLKWLGVKVALNYAMKRLQVDKHKFFSV
jgi:cyclic beta-1,2-glucan synthetase